MWCAVEEYSYMYRHGTELGELNLTTTHDVTCFMKEKYGLKA